MAKRKIDEGRVKKLRGEVARIEAETSPQAVAKESKERASKASRLAQENEAHFISLLEDCAKDSKEKLRDIRKEQAECWRVFNEEKPPNFAYKDPWQAQITVPKPFQSVKFFEAQIRKAFEYEYLTIENERDTNLSAFWRKFMFQQLGRSVSDFATKLADATGMGLAVGTSMEIIPRWRPWRGLAFDLIEPWKIHRDPDAAARDPQSGMYWIHDEWIDWYVLQNLAAKGKYDKEAVAGLKDLADQSRYSEDAGITKDEMDKMRNMVWNRGAFRNLIKVSEYWGTILDTDGEILIENGTFTVAGNRIISKPKPSYYKTLRWPGMSFSPMPHYLRFDGRSILQSVKSMWYFLCNLMSLHADNLNWIVNPMREVNIEALIDPADNKYYPGKYVYTRETTSGQQVVREVGQRSISNEVIANANFAKQAIDDGTFTTAPVTGGPGYRAEVTAREYMGAREQSLTVFAPVGKNIEGGAVSAIHAAAETIALNISYEELYYFMGDEAAAYYDETDAPLYVNLPHLSTGQFSVSGISNMLRDIEILNSVRDNFLETLGNPQLAQIVLPYIEPYNLLKSIEKRSGLKDEGILIDEERAKVIAADQQRAQEEAIQAERLAKQQAAEQAMQPPVPAMPPGVQ